MRSRRLRQAMLRRDEETVVKNGCGDGGTGHDSCREMIGRCGENPLCGAFAAELKRDARVEAWAWTTRIPAVACMARKEPQPPAPGRDLTSWTRIET